MFGTLLSGVIIEFDFRLAIYLLILNKAMHLTPLETEEPKRYGSALKAWLASKDNMEFILGGRRIRINF